MKLCTAICFVLLLQAATHGSESRPVADDDVSSRWRRHRHSPPPPAQRTHKLFVFGDDFADNGNSDSNPGLGYNSRAWRYPFGMSDTAHGRKPTGRFSDGLVQSDFLAKIMGYDESPPPYTSDDWDDSIDASGMNFATGDSGALQGLSSMPQLHAQVQQLRDLIRDGVIDHRDLTDSVALIAYSGNDYANGDDDDLVAKVVEEVGSAVSQLLDLGVTKVMVNTLPGCSPWLTRPSNYSSCGNNAVSDKHNKALLDRLAGEEDAMLLDVNSIMMDLVAPKEISALSQFTERLRPCCESTDGSDYCGKDGHYSLCDHPEEFFFWDAVHPTQAGWRAVMQLLQGPIMEFLGISNLEHL